MRRAVTAMLDYVLFHREPVRLFVEFLKQNSITPTMGDASTGAADEVYEISIPDDVDDDLLDKIDARYDELMTMNQQLFYEENPSDEGNFRVATILLPLKSGETSSAHIDPDLMAKIMEVISNEELDEFVTAIVNGVENPDERTYCQKVRAGDIGFDQPK